MTFFDLRFYNEARIDKMLLQDAQGDKLYVCNGNINRDVTREEKLLK